MEANMRIALSALVTNKEFVKENSHLIEPASYPRGPLRWLLEYIAELWIEERSLLTPELMEVALDKDSFFGTTPEEVVELYGQLNWYDDPDSRVARHRVARNWLRQQNLQRQQDDLAAALEANDLDAAASVLREASRGVNSSGEGLVLDPSAQDPAPLRPPIPTGLSGIDDVWKGGPRLGMVATVLAPSNQGKSMFLPYFAAQALLKGRNVLYYTNELSEGVVLERVVSAITQVPIDDIDRDFASYRDIAFQKLAQMRQMTEEETFFSPDMAQERSHYFEARFRDSGSLSALNIEADLEELLERGIRIHMVILDGDDIGVAYGKKYEKLYDMYIHVYTQLSELSRRRDVLIWTAAQATRASFHKKGGIKDVDVGDSIGKMRKADLMIGVQQQETARDARGNPFVIVRIDKDRYFSSKGVSFKQATKYGDKDVSPGVVGYLPYAGDAKEAADD